MARLKKAFKYIIKKIVTTKGGNRYTRYFYEGSGGQFKIRSKQIIDPAKSRPMRRKGTKERIDIYQKTEQYWKEKMRVAMEKAGKAKGKKTIQKYNREAQVARMNLYKPWK